MIGAPFAFNDVQVFRTGGSTTHYVIPEGATLLRMLLVGAGGRGGSGFAGAAASARGGGGAGGSGAVMRFSVPVTVLPRVIYVTSGLGVNSGTSTASYVGVSPIYAASNAMAFAAQGGFGGNGSATVAGTAGAGGGAFNVNTALLSGWGEYSSTAGSAGGAGGAVAGAAGGNATWGASGVFLSGGGGGGSTTSADFSGGSVQLSPLTPTITQGLAGTNRGNDGYANWSGPLVFTGGSGGGSSNTGVGGGGGDGSFGCGGGGAGAGTTSGAVGRGGDGFVMIWAIY